MECWKKVWIVTGAGSGLGRNIVEAALAGGHRVVATARDTMQLAELETLYGAQLRAATLDVTNERQAKEVVEETINTFGVVDVLVNNAGYGDNRPFEQVPPADFRRLVETCFFGVVTLSREVLPFMREQRSGHIINISSIGGWFATPGNVAYHASKWAVGGFTEGLALEGAPFNVKVTALEPGGMRTNWGRRAFSNAAELLPGYEDSVGTTRKALETYWGTEPGDPTKVAEVVLRIAEAGQLPAHIVLGQAPYEFVKKICERKMQEAERWKEVSAYTDISSTGPFPGLPLLSHGHQA